MVAGPHGVVGHYEKVHLAWMDRGEGEVFSPGEEFKVFDVDGIKVGINICMDSRSPVSSACLYHMGATLLLLPHGNYRGELGMDPSDWVSKKEVYLCRRAADVCCFAAACNSVGDVAQSDGRKRSFSGGAMIIGPRGEVMSRSASRVRKPHMVVADLDFRELPGVRPDRSIPGVCRAAYTRAFARPGAFDEHNPCGWSWWSPRVVRQETAVSCRLRPSSSPIRSACRRSRLRSSFLVAEYRPSAARFRISQGSRFRSYNSSAS